MENLSFESNPQKEAPRESKKEERSPYLMGEVPLEFSHFFSSGEKFEASQDDNGVAKITIERNGRIIFDASELLPPEWKIITPWYLKRSKPEKFQKFTRFQGNWYCNHEERAIMVGGSKSPKDLFALLHEIGHARTLSLSDMEARIKIVKKVFGTSPQKDRTEFPRLFREMIEIDSRSERNAWAWALGTFREFHIDFKAIFPAVKDIRQWIDSFLASHRQEVEIFYTLAFEPPSHFSTEESIKLRELLLRSFDKLRRPGS